MLLYYFHPNTLVIHWFRLKNLKKLHQQGSAEYDSRGGIVVIEWPEQGDNKLRKVKGGFCLAVHASHTAYHLKPLKLLMCYMITSPACQSQRWLQRLRGIILRQPHNSYLCQWFPLLTRRWQTKMFSVYNAFLETCRHISKFPLMWLPAKASGSNGDMVLIY